MAIATFERDPAVDTDVAEARFRLLQDICRTADARFCRALDRHSGRTCVVRVIDAGADESSRRLGDLHRERTLAERIAKPGVLRTDVPLIEGERIFQVVEPEPARAVAVAAEGGRLAVLQLLVSAGTVLAEAHSQGVFHGGFSRASCLRAADGRLIVQGFMGDSANAALARDGAARDHRAYLEFAQEMLQDTGGPPPRLRRYFARAMAADASTPAVGALADLCDELRESLEDTFPWLPGASTSQAAPAVQATARIPAATVAAKPAVVRSAARAPGCVVPVAADAPVEARQGALQDEPLSPLAAVRPVLSSVRPAVVALPATTTITAMTPATTPAADEPPGARSARPWIAALLLLGVLAATWQYASKARPAAEGRHAAPTAEGPAPTAAQPLPSPSASGPLPATPGPVDSAAAVEPNRAVPAAAVTGQGVGERAMESLAADSTPPPAAAAEQALRRRVATLVAGGNRALNALEPGAAAETFAAALALDPGNLAAQEGRQRARRLQGVDALVRDAREAAARGDHGRAVQGYSQALSSDPRNRGLAAALADARRSLGRDPTGVLLAEGHAALGAGRLERARDAFERALALDPETPGARRAAEQAATAILLRDEADARRAPPRAAAGR